MFRLCSYSGARNILFSNARALFHHRNFRTYFIGTTASMVGSWMQKIAIGWLTWSMTESSFWLGVVACADLLPIVLLSPAAGVLADRSHPRLIMMGAQGIAFAQAVTIAILFSLDLLGIELLVLMTLIHGLAMGVNQPARLIVIGKLVPAEELPTCIALNAVAFNLSRFVGPALAGFWIAAGDMSVVFALNALSFLVFLIALAALKLDPKQTAPGAETGYFTDALEAFRFITCHRGLFPILALMTISSFVLRPVVELLPSIADVIYGSGAGTLALFSSCMGLGAAVSGAWMASNAKPSPFNTILVASIAMSMCTGLLVLADNEIAGATVAFITGGGMLASSVSTQVLMQLKTPEALKGRVLSFYALIFIGAPALGALIIGLASDLVGLQAPFILASILTLAATLLTWRRRVRIARGLQ